MEKSYTVESFADLVKVFKETGLGQKLGQMAGHAALVFGLIAVFFVVVGLILWFVGKRLVAWARANPEKAKVILLVLAFFSSESSKKRRKRMSERGTGAPNGPGPYSGGGGGHSGGGASGGF
jgi:uncharacterized membrane protein YgcG